MLALLLTKQSRLATDVELEQVWSHSASQRDAAAWRDLIVLHVRIQSRPERMRPLQGHPQQPSST